MWLAAVWGRLWPRDISRWYKKTGDHAGYVIIVASVCAGEGRFKNNNKHKMIR